MSRLSRRARALVDHIRAKSPRQQVALVVDAVVVLAATVFVLGQLHPELLIANTTPSGGDMGAHVWGPAFLRDHLLPHGRLSGWSPDWYAGFPAYQFYMVVPSLLIVLFDVVLPYGIAFKLVTVLGLLSLPAAAYAFGRLADLRFPSPALLAIAAVPFLFNREPLLNNTGNIIGGNVASTLAGEFAFSISLTLAVLYLGVVVRGLRTGRYRALAAVLLGLTALCHVIPAIFAGISTVVLFVVWPSRQRLKWLAATVPVGLAISAFWLLPFYLRSDFLNNMGWKKLPDGGQSQLDYLVPNSLRWMFALAFVGGVLSFLYRLPAGVFLTLNVLVFAALFVVLPEGRLWNARLLPFYLLCAFLLAGLAVAEVGRAIATLIAANPARPPFAVNVATPLVALLAALVLVGLPLGVLPAGSRSADGTYHWLGFSVSSASRNVVRDWARWNYSGYERKAAYPEYYGLIRTMTDIGDDPDHGCGRAMWEYENDRLNSYGTPMAPMLLPFWTDGCIGSMEGLYFEASATTPYHFLNQAELSAKPSSAQRDLPYGPFDIDLGIKHLQLLGVKYYLAFSDTAVRAADAHPDLTEIATTGPWHIYEIADSELVTPLSYEPVVLDGVSDAGDSWLPVSVDFYDNPEAWDVFLASSGPPAWSRVAAGQTPPRRAVEPVDVSSISTGDDRISFDVDRPGTPVLVKTSYFPNWKVSGAEGPYRVTPNLMVVIPTGTHVELYYGWTGVDLSAWALTLLGIAAAIWLARRPALVMPEAPPMRGYDDADEDEADGLAYVEFDTSILDPDHDPERVPTGAPWVDEDG